MLALSGVPHVGRRGFAHTRMFKAARCAIVRAPMVPLRPRLRVELPPSWEQDATGRLAAAMAAAVGERGYAETHVSDVLERSGISRRTFYRHFSNREACFLAAYEAIVADLERLLDRSRFGGSPWESVVAETLGGVLEHFAAWPAHARVLLLDVLCAGARGIERHERTIAALAARLAACERWLPGSCPTLEREEIAQAAVGAMLRIVQLRLLADGSEGLGGLAPVLAALVARTAVAPAAPAAQAAC
jgi:AcrR family transcriptional regulator